MFERQPLGMEHQAVRRRQRLAVRIQIAAQNRMADMGEMNSQLMAAPGLRP